MRKIEDDTAETQMDIKVTSMRVLIVATCTSSFANIICMKIGIATGTTGNHVDAVARCWGNGPAQQSKWADCKGPRAQSVNHVLLRGPGAN